MKQLAIILMVMYACNVQSQNKKSNPISQELLAVQDSISQLMSKYQYNPKELSAGEYIALEKK
jgi:hypothetical protein